MIDRRGLTIGLLGLGSGSATHVDARPAALPQPDAGLWDPQPGTLREGEARGPNGAVYYRRYGPARKSEAGRTPVLVLHGGPAAGHRYMRPYAALATDREVVLYDQSGSGRSARPADLKLFTVDRYVEELEAVRAQLGLERVVLLGHSWGGMLAPAYAQRHPDRVAALVLAGSAARWCDFEAAVWLKELGPRAVATVRAAERTGKTDSPAYGKVLEAYYARHLCRLNPPPAWFQAEGEALASNPVYVYLNGPSEFQFTGALRPLNVVAALRGVRVPTLVTCGEFDEAPAPIARKIVALVKGAELQVFDGLSHMTHIEDPRRVVAATAAFLHRRT